MNKPISKQSVLEIINITHRRGDYIFITDDELKFVKVEHNTLFCFFEFGKTSPTTKKIISFDLTNAEENKLYQKIKQYPT